MILPTPKEKERMLSVVRLFSSMEKSEIAVDLVCFKVEFVL
ncbi:hypothetical protein POREN0001_1865 [Porphyromonas endodontalis ATCC 35406]|uniref:Uncharacterized protein n=1 Tax=Porphyromonas endodontalis (strain ATCC 35406 / DSM 24491 / JCM 8526 / CCUG 16442 / BCRC 14492 / NCTC 13058 / HG 370) TaxID=553175 RepID=C3JBX7_POREA|nr:hypothetical protein POREN0001_1865 [Porphyromonas endodontalis ATCC 35406]